MLLREVIQQLATSLQGTAYSDDQALREARLVVEAALELTPLTLLTHANSPLQTFPPAACQRLQEFSQRRLQGEPLSRICGKRGFWKSIFDISPATLDPRPETEGLIEHALSFFQDKTPPTTIIDLGVGSGCLLLSLLQEFPEALGIGVDLSPEALAVAADNARRLHLERRCTLRKNSWMEGIEGSFDLIVTNPPYIPSEDILSLSREVQNFDPHLALDGGKDGLDAYRQLIPQAASALSENGLFLLECGIHQELLLRPLMEAHFKQVAFYPDLAGIMRYGAGLYC